MTLHAACGAAGPSHHARTYRVPPDVGRLVVDEEAFAEFARPLRADLEADLARPEVRDPDRKEREFTLAILDALDERWAPSEAALARIMARAEKPAERLMTGLTIRIWADAVRAGGKERDAFRDAAEKKIGALPTDVVHEQLEVLREMGRSFTPEFCRGLVDEHIGPAARKGKGSIGFEDAQAVVFQRWALKRLSPVGDILVEILDRKLQ